MGKFCTNCGKSVTGNFCANCGTPTQNDGLEQTTISVVDSNMLPTTLNGVEVVMAYLLIEFRTKSGIDKIGLIKKVREITGAGLTESKEFVDAHCEHIEAKDAPITGSVLDMSFPPTEEDRKLSEKTWFIVLMLILFWPVGLYLTFANKHYSMSTKFSILGFYIAILFVGFICAGSQA